MKFYRRYFKDGVCLYWVSVREIPKKCNGENAIGVLYSSNWIEFLGFKNTEFVAKDKQEIGIELVPEILLEHIGDPLFDIEFEKWAKKNGF